MYFPYHTLPENQSQIRAFPRYYSSSIYLYTHKLCGLLLKCKKECLLLHICIWRLNPIWHWGTQSLIVEIVPNSHSSHPLSHWGERRGGRRWGERRRGGVGEITAPERKRTLETEDEREEGGTREDEKERRRQKREKEKEWSEGEWDRKSVV